MSAQIIAFLRGPAPQPVNRDWSTHEIAEFYRVEGALLQSGLRIETDRGVSDEGDPWFVFCRADTGEVFIHFARIDGEYLIDGAIFAQPMRGRDFASLVRELIARHPLARNKMGGSSNVTLHPAALLIALVGTAFFHTSHAKAAELGETRPETKRLAAPVLGLASAPATDSIIMDANQAAVLITSAMASLRAPTFAERDEMLSSLAATPSSGSTQTALFGSSLEVSGGSEVASAGAAALRSAAQSAEPGADVKAVLSVVAILHELAGLPSGSLSVPHADVLVGAPSASPVSENDLIAAPTASPPHPWLVVTLSAGSAPEVQAVAIVAASGAFVPIDVRAAPNLEQLPAMLADLIGHGQHIDGALHPAIQLSDSTAPVAPPPAQTVEPSVAPPPALIQPADSVAPPTPPASTPAATHDPSVDAALAAFEAEVHQPSVLVSGHDVVVYDHQIFGPLPAGTALNSVTFTLPDGSTLSLVGTAQEIADLHLLH